MEPTQTILIIDDVPENLTILGGLLSPHYRVRVARSGMRGLQVAASEPKPDLILLDIMMPDMDGYEVLKQLRADSETGVIPVIFVTALNSTEDEMKGLSLGVADYITKPVHPAALFARVRAQLQLKRARDVLRNKNCWLEKEIKQRMRQNQIIQDICLRALASLAETRDCDTGHHILRTRNYVQVLCETLIQGNRFAELTSYQCIDKIAKAAPLHDIGKVGIPDHILLKPGQLDSEEWAIMQTHTTLGADSIIRATQGVMDQAGLEFLRAAMQIARSHHERWDGSGYPDGLSGKNIPLPARLMAVADVFDALISRRVYKPALSVDDAMALILLDKGRHFDPDVVNAFVARFDDFKAIAARYANE